MTPAQHAAAAVKALADAKAAVANGVPHTRVAQIHAVLSKTTGTGEDYAAAEALLAATGAPLWSTQLLDQALAHALLAQ